MIYLTGAYRASQAPALAQLGVGVMLQPGNSYAQAVEALGFPCWAADNGCFAKGDAFDLDGWYRWLDTVPTSRLLFVVAPDVYRDADATLARSLPELRRLDGRPRAFVAQNGADDETIPWDDFEWLFLGGDNAFKLGEEARLLVLCAKMRGKSVHMGRVNSERRLRYAAMIACDSADGTFLRFRNRAGDGAADLAKWFTQSLLPLGEATHGDG